MNDIGLRLVKVVGARRLTDRHYEIVRCSSLTDAWVLSGRCLRAVRRTRRAPRCLLGSGLRLSMRLPQESLRSGGAGGQVVVKALELGQFVLNALYQRRRNGDALLQEAFSYYGTLPVLRCSIGRAENGQRRSDPTAVREPEPAIPPRSPGSPLGF
jgi:hypothetical protein